LYRESVVPPFGFPSIRRPALAAPRTSAQSLCAVVALTFDPLHTMTDDHAVLGDYSPRSASPLAWRAGCLFSAVMTPSTTGQATLAVFGSTEDAIAAKDDVFGTAAGWNSSNRANTLRAGIAMLTRQQSLALRILLCQQGALMRTDALPTVKVMALGCDSVVLECVEVARLQALPSPPGAPGPHAAAAHRGLTACSAGYARPSGAGL
jgi:hypothetical protein